jgi:hypothetical protein
MASKSTSAQLAAMEKRFKKYVEKDVPAARRIAINKVMKPVKTRVISGVAKQTKVRPSAIRKRVKVTAEKTGNPATITFDRRGVSLISLGAVRKNKRGISAGRRQFNGHFIGSLRAGDSQRYRHVLYRREELRKKGQKAPLWLPRIPIKIVSTRVTPKVVRREFRDKFKKEYAEAMRYLRKRT